MKCHGILTAYVDGAGKTTFRIGRSAIIVGSFDSAQDDGSL